MTPFTSDALDTNPLLTGLSPAQLAVVKAACVTRQFSAGEVMLQADTVSDGMNFLEMGEAEVVGPSTTEIRLTRKTTLACGQEFGATSAMTGIPAVTTVRAMATPTRVLTLPRERLDTLPDGDAISRIILRNIAKMNQLRDPSLNVNSMQHRRRNRELFALRKSSTRLLNLVIMLMSITILTNHWVLLHPSINVYSPAFAWGALLPLLVPTVFVAWRENYPLKTYGITTRNLGPDLAWSTGIIVGGIALGTISLLLAGYPVVARFRIDYLVRFGPLYALNSALQEFIVRGVLLGMMLRIFGSTSWRERQASNVAVSLMFGLVHIQFGLIAVGVTMVFSLLVGSYFFIYRNLAGPILIHSALGLAAFMIGII